MSSLEAKQLSQVAEKLTPCHSEGRGLPEESAVSWKSRRKQIPRFARDDKKYFFHSLFSLLVLCKSIQRQQVGRAVKKSLNILSFRAKRGISLSFCFAHKKQGEIPRFARNDKKGYAFRSLFNLLDIVSMNSKATGFSLFYWLL